MNEDAKKDLHITDGEMDNLFEDVIALVGDTPNNMSTELGRKIHEVFWNLYVKKIKERLLKNGKMEKSNNRSL